MTIKTSIEFKGLAAIQKRLRDLQRPPSRQLMEEVADAGAVLMQRRVQVQSQDKKGAKLRQYSDGYLKKRRAHNRKTDVDLTITGAMWRSLQPGNFSKTGANASIQLAFRGFAPRRQLSTTGRFSGGIKMISNAKLAFWQNQMRPFFGFKSTERRKLQALFTRLYKEEQKL